jgi:steroid 5-alpha reductase family enzyme
MATIEVFFYSLVAALIFMTAFYLVAVIKDDYSIVDTAWGLGFVVISRVSLGTMEEATTFHFIANLLVLIWGLRLAFYLWSRNKKVGEDYRYQEMRRDWGKSHRLHAFFKVFMLQGVLMWIISFPIMMINAQANRVPFNDFTHYIGLGLWVIGFLFEVGGDWQLARFKADPANKGLVMDKGFWRYTRHPNYFGETVLWWGFFLLTFTSIDNLWTVIGPVLITILLLKVSGVSLLEKKLSKNSKYAEYQRKTSAFIPLPPKP